MATRGSPSLGVSILTLTFLSAALMPFGALAQQVPVESIRVSASILNQTNAYRQSLGLPRLKWNQQLNRAAQLYANYLASTNKRGHSADNTTVGQRIAASGFQACGKGQENLSSAENLFYRTRPSPETEAVLGAAAVPAWRASPEHHRFMVYNGFTDLGAAAAAWRHNGMIEYKVVQLFGGNCLPAGPAQFPRPR